MSNNGARDKTMDVGGVTVRIRELTVGEIGEWMNDRLNPPLDASADPLPSLLTVGSLTLADLFRMTDLNLESARPLTGSELEQIADGCRAVNQSFFALAETIALGMTAVAEQFNDALNPPSKTSTKPAPH